jgi:hypothetical protein
MNYNPENKGHQLPGVCEVTKPFLISHNKNNAPKRNPKKLKFSKRNLQNYEKEREVLLVQLTIQYFLQAR